MTYEIDVLPTPACIEMEGQELAEAVRNYVERYYGVRALSCVFNVERIGGWFSKKARVTASVKIAQGSNMRSPNGKPPVAEIEQFLADATKCDPRASLDLESVHLNACRDDMNKP